MSVINHDNLNACITACNGVSNDIDCEKSYLNQANLYYLR